MAKKVLAINLPPANDLFTTQEERDDAQREKIQDIPLSEIDSFPDHPFQVKNDESMQAMVDSVKAVGIQTPAVVRIKDDGRFELVSGHRRKLACELAGLEFLPCIVREMSQDESIIAMVDSNLQREVILPSEKAWSYRMKLEAIKRQGQRTDLTSTPSVSKLRNNEKVGIELGDSREQVRRYIRLTELIPQLLDMVDENQLAMRPAVELSYLSQEHQQALLGVIESEECIHAIDEAIGASNYKPNLYNLKLAAIYVIGVHGFSRVNAVVAHHIQKHENDGRYSRGVKKWARHFVIPGDTCAFLNSHATLVDSFAAHVRKLNADSGAPLPGRSEYDEPDSVHGYETIQSILFSEDEGLVISCNPIAPDEYACWEFTVNNGKRDYCRGVYGDKRSATDDYNARLFVKTIKL